MANTGYLTSLDDLEVWFKKLNTPKFNLYAGRNNTNQGARIMKLDAETHSVEDAWDELKAILERMTHGYFTVFVPTSGKNVGDRITIYRGPANQAQAAGMGALPGSGVLVPGIGLVPPEKIDEAIKSKLEEERYRWELEKRLEELENQGAPASFWEKVWDKIAENEELPRALMNVCTTLIDRFANQGRPAALAGYGQPGQAQQQAVNEAGEMARIQAALEQIAEVFPDLTGFLEGLAAYVKANPEQAKMIFEQIRQQ